VCLLAVVLYCWFDTSVIMQLPYVCLVVAGLHDLTRFLYCGFEPPGPNKIKPTVYKFSWNNSIKSLISHDGKDRFCLGDES